MIDVLQKIEEAKKDKSKPCINLFGSKDIGLLVPYPSGIIYQVQAAGMAVYKFSLEGFFVPFYINRIYQQEELIITLNHHFTKEVKYSPNPVIENETADFLEKVFDENKYTKKWSIKVNREPNYLSKSFEAWVHVSFNKDNILHNASLPNNAILTWLNSD